MSVLHHSSRLNAVPRERYVSYINKKVSSLKECMWAIWWCTQLSINASRKHTSRQLWHCNELINCHVCLIPRTQVLHFHFPLLPFGCAQKNQALRLQSLALAKYPVKHITIILECVWELRITTQPTSVSWIHWETRDDVQRWFENGYFFNCDIRKG